MLRERHLAHASRWLSVLTYALCYALYAVVLFLCYQSFWIWRSTAEVVAGHFHRKGEWFQFLYLSMTLVVGIIMFAVIVGSEGYLRHSIDQPSFADRIKHGPVNRLVRRFLRIAVPLVLGLLIAVALQEWVYKRAGA